MEATCQYVESEKNAPVGDATWESDGAMSWVCGAPIPRLDGQDGEDCVECGEQRWDHVDPDHSYLGPLASECANGHPVAVPTQEVNDALAG